MPVAGVELNGCICALLLPAAADGLHALAVIAHGVGGSGDEEDG